MTRYISEINAVGLTTRKALGEAAEAAFLAKATSLGFGVTKTWGDSERYDFILDSGQKLWRIQVKSSRRSDGSRYIVKLKGKSAYTAKEIDFIVARIVPENLWYVIPISVAALRGQMYVSPGGTRHFRHEKYEDYSLDKSKPITHNPTHEDKRHFFLGLAAEADARNCLRKSFFIDASNFRVGTLRSASIFSFSDGVLTMTLPDVTELFSTDEKCRDLLERLRWPEGPECPRCKSHEVVRLVTAAKLLYCNECEYQFTVTVGTIFHDSHLPLTKWFMVTLLLCEAKKGMSASQVKRTIWGQHKGSYKTAWYLCHRIRAAMAEAERPMLDGTIEMDETYVGGKQRNPGRGRATTNKEVVIGIRQRGGDVRFFHAEDARKGTLAKYIQENLSADVDVIITDELPAYNSAVGDLKHEAVNHSRKEYVRPGTDIHTNTVESAFSLLKRGIMGSWHKISAKHLPAYLAEMEFRFNRRKSPALFLDTLRHMITAPVLTFEKLTA